MKNCQKCGYTSNDNADFCTNCGASFSSQQAYQPQQGYPEQQVYQPQPQQAASSVFIESGENVVATLGNGVLQNVLSGGGLSTINATLTDKRLYVSGKCLESIGLGWVYAKISRIIEVEDITGTGFVYVSKPSLLVTSILFIIGALVTMTMRNLLALTIILFVIAAILITAFFVTKKNVFQIEYAGGRIGFDVKWIKADLAANFQKKIHIVKRDRKKAERK